MVCCRQHWSSRRLDRTHSRHGYRYQPEEYRWRACRPTPCNSRKAPTWSMTCIWNKISPRTRNNYGQANMLWWLPARKATKFSIKRLLSCVCTCYLPSYIWKHQHKHKYANCWAARTIWRSRLSNSWHSRDSIFQQSRHTVSWQIYHISYSKSRR